MKQDEGAGPGPAEGMTERLWAYFLGRFWRFLFAVLFALFGILWAFFGLGKALLVAALALLGFLFGKWLDEGKPNAGLFRALRRFLD
jgi:hypothetical protein